MRRSILNLIATTIMLGIGWQIPHSPLKVTLETPTPTPAVVLVEETPSPIPAPVVVSPTPEADPFGELYFTLFSYEQGMRLVRLPGACIAGQFECPEPELVKTPFEMKDVWANLPKGMAWTRDGKYGVMVTHPEDELSRGRTSEEMALLMTQSIDDMQISNSTIHLFEAETDTWREVYQAERKFIYSPVWSADGQWLAFGVRSSVWAFHPIQADDGIYVIHADGSGLKKLAAVDANIMGWVGGSVLVRRSLSPYPAVNYTIELLSLDGHATSLFSSSRVAIYNLAPDGGALLVSDMQGENSGNPQKSVELMALDGSITHTFGVYSNSSQSIWSTAWSNDSSKIAFANLRRVYIAERDSEPRQVYLADDSYVTPRIDQMGFSPDQKFLLLDVYDGTPTMVVIALESGQTSELSWPGMNLGQQASNFSWRP